MKLVENNEIVLFERGIKINDYLPKYKRIKEVKSPQTLNPDRADEISPEEYQEFMKHQGLIELNIEELFRDDNENLDASDFNIKISVSLKRLIGDEVSRIFNSVMSPSSNSFGEKEEKGNILSILRKTFGRVKSKIQDPRETINLLDVFGNIKIEAGKEKKYVSRIYSMINSLKKAEMMNQEALKEKIFKEMIINKYESILWACGYNKYITETDLLTFSMLSKKSLSLDYIENYSLEIPDEIVEKKLKMDLLEIFDNYVILHYDPEKKASLKTEKEKRVEKDPILFGVISGSKKLYYVGDWITPEDNLEWKTIEETFKKLPEKLLIPEKITFKL